jgi:hypothetical protein
VYEYDGTTADIAGFRMQTGSTFEYNVHRLLETRVDQRDAPAQGGCMKNALTSGG